jgi:hypothetical protein
MGFRHYRTDMVRSSPASSLEGAGFEPVWGISCQVVFWFVGGSLTGRMRPSRRRWINPLGLGRSLETVAYLARNWKFESIPLQRGVSELSVHERQTISTPAADALSGTHPLAATLALRAMIDFSLKNNRSSRYRYAARHLIDCSSLASAIEDFGRFEPHDAYEARLRREHPRKSSFWSLVD